MFEKIKIGAAAVKAFSLAHAPVALFVGGIILVGAAIVETIKTSTDADKIAEIEHAVEELEEVNSALTVEDITPEERKRCKKLKKTATARVAKSAGKAYFKPIILIMTAIIFLICGFWWQSQRLAAAAAAATASATALNTVNRNIRTFYGEDGDAAVRAFNDPNFDPSKVKKTIIDDLGNTKEVDAWRSYKPGKISIPDVNSWRFEFARENVNPECWYDDIIDRLEFIQMRQSFLNEKLKYCPKNGGITVNEALDELGLGCLKTKAGHVSGWKKGDVIDFGINDILSDYLFATTARSVQDIEEDIDYNGGSITLIFNPRGYILDDMFTA